MSKRRDSEEAALADRLVNYSDALVAVAFLGLSGLGLAVADPDIRCSVAEAVPEVIVANLVNAVLITGLLVVLRRWELDLRSDAPQTGKVARYAGWLNIARLVIVWVSLLLSIQLALASDGENCDLTAEAPERYESPAAESIWPGRSPVG